MCTSICLAPLKLSENICGISFLFFAFCLPSSVLIPDITSVTFCRDYKAWDGTINSFELHETAMPKAFALKVSPLNNYIFSHPLNFLIAQSVFSHFHPKSYLLYFFFSNSRSGVALHSDQCVLKQVVEDTHQHWLQLRERADRDASGRVPSTHGRLKYWPDLFLS